MTTIAWDGKWLAADRQVTTGSCIDGEATKVVRRKDGALCGAAGDLSDMYEFHRWFLAGEKKEHPCVGKSNFCAIVVRPDGALLSYDASGMSTHTAKFTAIGDGRELAMGAMAAGKNAIDTLLIVSTYNINTGCGIDAFEFGTKSAESIR